MKAHVNLMKCTSVMLVCLICSNVTIAQAQQKFKTFKKSPTPIVKLGIEYTSDPYEVTELDYHDFKMQGEDSWSTTKGEWYLKYKKMFDFRCKEPFLGGGPEYTKNDYLKFSYEFRLVDNQVIEDSIQFLLNKYPLNSKDTLKKWNLPPSNAKNRKEQIIKRLGLNHFKFVIAAFNVKKNTYPIDVPEAEQANDEMVKMRVFKYPAEVDILLYNYKTNNWEYVESVTVSGDHELELYVLQKFEPRYLKDCKQD